MEISIDFLYDIQCGFLFTGSIIACCWLGKWNRKMLERDIAQDDTEKWDVQEKNRFLSLFAEDETVVNSNIHPEIYCFEKLNAILERESEEEKIWKHRILFQSTPQGNIIMFYDLYKQSFTYFSDMQITYKWLNICAMKYVRIFRCREFFQDNSELPDGFKNKLNMMILEQIENEKKKKKEKKKKLDIDLNSDAFLRKKPKEKEEKVENSELSRFINKFRRAGNIQSYQITQKIELEKSATKTFNYKDFKKQKNIAKINDLLEE